MRHYWLLQNLITREVRARYLGSATGLLWALLQPLALLGIYAFVFSTIFKLRFPELGDHRFIAFVAVVLWPWQMFAEGLQRGMSAIHANAALVKKTAFAREILVYANLGAAWIVHLAGYAVVLVSLMLFGETITWGGLPLAFLVMVTLASITLALALVLAALQVFVRDVEHVLGPALMILFYATPILYPLSMVPGELQKWFGLNPLAALVGRLRDALLFAATPQWGDLWYLAGAAAAIVAALLFFRRLEPHFEDFL
jgi:ABC-type polysaccharide/polyol phosphate export permease